MDFLLQKIFENQNIIVNDGKRCFIHSILCEVKMFTIINTVHPHSWVEWNLFKILLALEIEYLGSFQK